MVIGCFGLQKEFSMRLYSAVLIEFWRTEWHPVIFTMSHSAADWAYPRVNIPTVKVNYF